MLVTNQTTSDIYFGPLHLGAGVGTTLTVDDTSATSLYLTNDSVADALNNAYNSNKITVSGAADPFPRPTGDPALLHGSGNPEGLVFAPQGSVYLRRDGVQSNGGVIYMKTTGVTLNTGWLNLATASGATALLPAGTIAGFGGAAAPTGWLLCDGSAVSRAVYSILFSAIGTTYGAGDGSTTFNLPNLKGKVPVGLDATQSEFDVLAETGGAKTHTLSTGEIPAHSHGVNDPGHSHAIETRTAGTAGGVMTSWGGSSVQDAALGGVISSVGAGISIQNAGGGGAHNNLQPYIVVNYIIKT